MSGGVPRQVRGASGLADIIVENPYRYRVDSYLQYSGGGGGNPYTPVGAPFATVVVENPDGPAGTNRLTVTRNGVPVGTYSFLDASGTLELATGFSNGTRKELLQETSL